MKKFFAAPLAIALLLVGVAGVSPAHAELFDGPMPTIGDVNMPAVSPDGSWVVSVSTNDGITIYDVATATATTYDLGLTGSFTLGWPVFAPDSQSFYVPNNTNGSIYNVRASDGWILGTYGYFGDSNPWLLGITGDGNRLIVNRWDGSMVILGMNPATGFGTPFAVASGNVSQMCTSPDGSLAYVVDYGDDDIDVVDVAQETVIAHWTNPAMNGPTSCAVDADGTLYVGDSLTPQVHRFAADGSSITSAEIMGNSEPTYKPHVNGLAVACGQLYAGLFGIYPPTSVIENTIAVLDPATLDFQTSFAVDDTDWTTWGGASSESTNTVWFGGYRGAAGLLGIKNECVTPTPTPDPKLPDTGISGSLNATAGVLGGALVVVGLLALILVRRKLR